jgi:hypothetical protein
MSAGAPGPGLCADCVFHKVVVSGRGSRFWLCQRSRFDPRFPRYPALPVLACSGYRHGRPRPADS